MGWYESSYRKLFFDFHSPREAIGLASGFDAERWAERLEKAHAQAVSVFIMGARGWSFYRKGSYRHVHPHLPEGLDMVEQQLASLHKRGIKGIGYHATLPSEALADEHPEWREVDAQGQRSKTGMCMLSPVFEQWLLPHVAEVVSLYELDAMFFDGTFARGQCSCPYCRERFSSFSGGLELPKDSGDANWPQFVEWKLQAYREIRRALCAVIHEVRPEMPVSFNWAYSMRQPEVVPEHVGSLMIDIFPDDQAFNGSYQARYWATCGKPFDIMNSAFLRWWGDWGCKPAVAMQQEAATIMANGGLTWIGYQMNEKFDIEDAVMCELGKTLAFVEERESLFEGAEPWPAVAALRSTRSNICADQPHFFVDETTPRGLHRALTESMIPYLYLHEEALLQRLDEFAVIILADQRHLSEDLVAALPEWVAKGGVLIATAFSGTVDAHNASLDEWALGDLLGLRLTGRYEHSHAYVKVTDDRLAVGTLDMAHMVECPVALVEATAPDVQVLAELYGIYLRADGQFLLSRSPVGEDTGHPAVTSRKVGQGYAAYLAPEIFYAYQKVNQWNAKMIATNLVRLLRPDLPVEVSAPAWLEVVPMRQGNRLLVHLVNHHGNRPVHDTRAYSGKAPPNNVCVEQVLPVNDVTVRLRLEHRPRQVRLEPGGVEPSWKYAGGYLQVHLSSVYIHTALCVET